MTAPKFHLMQAPDPDLRQKPNLAIRPRAGQSPPQTESRAQAEQVQYKRGSDVNLAPGSEFPAVAYRSIALAFAGMLLAAWQSFGGDGETNFVLIVILALCIVTAAIPFIIRRLATGRSSPLRAAAQPVELKRFLLSRVDTATGPLSGREALLQVLLIPLALAVAMTAIGLVYVWVA